MRTSTLLCALLLCAACSRTHDHGPVTGTPVGGPTPGMAPAAPANLQTVTGKSACQADAECPGDRLCRIEDGACIARYPRAVLRASHDGNATARSCELSGVFFAFDSAELAPEAREWLDHNASCLKTLNLGSLVVEGHADVQGAASYNQDLAQRRAEAVRRYLETRGVNIPLTVRSMGEQSGAHTWSERELAWQRRVELRVR